MNDVQKTDWEDVARAEVAAPTFPLPEVPDWDEQVGKASKVCSLVDRHLDYEARGRLLQDPNDFRPRHLCPEQRVQMVSDLHAAVN